MAFKNYSTAFMVPTQMGISLDLKEDFKRRSIIKENATNCNELLYLLGTYLTFIPDLLLGNNIVCPYKYLRNEPTSHNISAISTKFVLVSGVCEGGLRPPRVS